MIGNVFLNTLVFDLPKLEHFSISYELFKFQFYFPKGKFSKQAGRPHCRPGRAMGRVVTRGNRPVAGPGWRAGRDTTRTGRPLGRPKTGVQAGRTECARVVWWPAATARRRRERGPRKRGRGRGCGAARARLEGAELRGDKGQGAARQGRARPWPKGDRRCRATAKSPRARARERSGPGGRRAHREVAAAVARAWG